VIESVEGPPNRKQPANAERYTDETERMDAEVAGMHAPIIRPRAFLSISMNGVFSLSL